MKINSNVSFCRVCSEKISILGYPCSSLMELVLDLYFQSIPFTFHDGNENDRIFKIPLEFLETKGFILSTEVEDEWIQVIPKLSGRLCWC